MKQDIQGLLFALVWILSTCLNVEALYKLEVELHGYDNPTGRCYDCFTSTTQSRGCCDRHNTTTACTTFGCDSYFFYCLQAFGEVGDRGCVRSESVTSDVNHNDGFISFSQNTVLGLSNPFNLNGLTHEWNGVQLFIRVTDDDINDADDLIDIVQVNHNLSIGESSTGHHLGIYGYVTMELTVRALCVDGFAGPNCSQCVTGYTGTLCDVKLVDLNETSTDIHKGCNISMEVPEQSDMQHANGVTIGVTVGILVLVFLCVLVTLSVIFLIVIKKTAEKKRFTKKPDHNGMDCADNRLSEGFLITNNMVYDVPLEIPDIETRRNYLYSLSEHVQGHTELTENVSYNSLTEYRDVKLSNNMSYGNVAHTPNK